LAINNLGQVVGSSKAANGDIEHAFLYSNGTMQDIGTLGGKQSYAIAINNAGQVVGGSTTENPDGIFHFFLYSNGTMLDLNTLANAAANGWTITDVRGINDSGKIVGSAKNSYGD
ncbi:HAF repeat-containing protein, partial [bacterium]|nr:HAF repeat-containing protein [bacterium]